MRTIERRHLITFLQRSTQTEENGQRIESWDDWKKIFAALEYTQNDSEGQQRDTAKADLKVKCKAVRDLSVKHRIRVDDKDYNIESINFPVSRKDMEITATEVVD